MIAATNRAATASAGSQLSHAVGRSGWAANQSASRAVLPAPGEPITKVSRACRPRSRASSSLDLRTRRDGVLGAWNLDGGKRGLRRPSPSSPFLSAIIGCPPTFADRPAG